MAVTHFLPSFVTDIVTDASFTENDEKNAWNSCLLNDDHATYNTLKDLLDSGAPDAIGR